MEIPLFNGMKCQVDDCDFEFLSQFTWTYSGGYAVTALSVYGRNYTTRMHRVIMAAPAGLEVDHRNRDRLDNRRRNLRFCTRGQNNHNSDSKVAIRRKGKFTSKYVGVKKNRNGSFTARIWFDKKAKELGTFRSEEDARSAVIAGSKKYYGEFSPYHMRCEFDETGVVNDSQSTN